MVLFCFLFSLTSHILDGWHQFQFAEQLLSYLSVLPPNPPSLLLLALHTWPTLLYSALLHRMALLARLLPHLSTLQSETRTSGYALTCEDSCMHGVGWYTQVFLCLHVSKNPEFRLKMLCIFSPPVTLFVCRFYLSSIWLFPWQSKPVEFSRRRS